MFEIIDLVIEGCLIATAVMFGYFGIGAILTEVVSLMSKKNGEYELYRYIRNAYQTEGTYFELITLMPIAVIAALLTCKSDGLGRKEHLKDFNI